MKGRSKIKYSFHHSWWVQTMLKNRTWLLHLRASPTFSMCFNWLHEARKAKVSAADLPKVPLEFEYFTTPFFWRIHRHVTHIIWTSTHEDKLGFGMWFSSDCMNSFPSTMLHSKFHTHFKNSWTVLSHSSSSYMERLKYSLSAWLLRSALVATPLWVQCMYL